MRLQESLNASLLIYFGQKAPNLTDFGEEPIMVYKYNSSLLAFTRDDSLLPRSWLGPLQHVLSGWWCGPPEGGWWCLCLHSLTGRWRTSTWPAPGAQSPREAAHMGYETQALWWGIEKCKYQRQRNAEDSSTFTWWWRLIYVQFIHTLMVLFFNIYILIFYTT